MSEDPNVLVEGVEAFLGVHGVESQGKSQLFVEQDEYLHSLGLKWKQILKGEEALLQVDGYDDGWVNRTETTFRDIVLPRILIYTQPP